MFGVTFSIQLSTPLLRRWGIVFEGTNRGQLLRFTSSKSNAGASYLENHSYCAKGACDVRDEIRSCHDSTCLVCIWFALFALVRKLWGPDSVNIESTLPISVGCTSPHIPRTPEQAVELSSTSWNKLQKGVGVSPGCLYRVSLGN